MTEPHTPQTVNSTAFREAMSRIATAVHLVTTDGASGRAGATVSAMCSVTDDPATILVCINRESRLNAAIRDNGCFCLSTLGPEHEEVSNTFAGRGEQEMERRFDGLAFETMNSGAPALRDARLNVDCRLDQAIEAGTHTVFFGRVTDIRLNDEGRSLLYVHRAYASA
ncbi:flavin reductase family protein [Roseibium aestuarii]|uniref:Flavin reductase family protein n=1 Tax=Roseibium aestuarii TaxID=2600299 RepID=A0ABW4JZN3_9HYPH|nr:flavin reductase family protein [Roseibium aestuarii]